MTPTAKNTMTMSVLGRLKQGGMPEAQQENLDPEEPGISPEEKQRRIQLQLDGEGYEPGSEPAPVSGSY
jgi:hypothetical protein